MYIKSIFTILLYGVILGTSINTTFPQESWTSTSTNMAPSPRVGHCAVWTGPVLGGKMIVWGGYTGFAPLPVVNTGAMYDPQNDTWQQCSISNAPQGRYFFTAVWTGSKMIVWGGKTWDTVSYSEKLLNTGGIYDPVSNTWTATSTANAPKARCLSLGCMDGKQNDNMGRI